VKARVLARNSDKSTELSAQGMDVVPGDFEDRESLKRALGGVDTAFLLAPFVPNMLDLQLAFIEAAKEAGVRRIVKLSAMGTAPDAPVAFLRWHATAEQALRESGLAYTALQPNGFMQNLLGMAPLISTQGIIPAPAGDSRISHIDVRDIAASAVAVLTQPGHDGKTYVLSGPAAVTYEEIAADVSEAIGKKVTYVPITPEQFLDGLTSTGVPQWMASGLGELYALYRTGAGATVTNEVEALAGRPAIPFAQFARDYAGAFK
jgi:uncharacterized protein YbjT (DUF2867 family)